MTKEKKREYDALRYKRLRDKILERSRVYAKIYREKKREKILAYGAEYRENNRQRERIRGRKYYIENRQKEMRRSRKYRNYKYHNDLLFKLRINLSNRSNKIFKRMGMHKTHKSIELLGADYQTIKNFIEQQFKENMGWHNRKLWHIDHKIPLSSARNKEELLKLFHYTNLQPLWAEENLKKGAKYVK